MNPFAVAQDALVAWLSGGLLAASWYNDSLSVAA